MKPSPGCILGYILRSALQFQIQVSDSDSDLNMKRGTKCGIAQSLFME